MIARTRLAWKRFADWWQGGDPDWHGPYALRYQVQPIIPPFRGRARLQEITRRLEARFDEIDRG